MDDGKNLLIKNVKKVTGDRLSKKNYHHIFFKLRKKHRRKIAPILTLPKIGG
jgi:hypothetical protein